VHFLLVLELENVGFGNLDAIKPKGTLVTERILDVSKASMPLVDQVINFRRDFVKRLNH